MGRKQKRFSLPFGNPLVDSVPESTIFGHVKKPFILVWRFSVIMGVVALQKIPV
jgi:hypothetical protein